MGVEEEADSQQLVLLAVDQEEEGVEVKVEPVMQLYLWLLGLEA